MGNLILKNIRGLYSRLVRLRGMYILIVLLGSALALSLIFIIKTPAVISEGKLAWKYKEEDIKSRLLSVPILLYHNIDGKGPFSIDCATLREHFQLIKDRGIRVIPLKELIERLEKPVPFEDRVIVITFDDGYPSMYTKLLPLAEEFGYPVTLFVYTDFVYTKAKNGITWDKLRRMDKAGIDIQCHSISHENLRRFSSRKTKQFRKKLFDELYMSKRIEELYLGKKIEFFAYPYGQYDLRIVDMSKLCGYRRVFSTDYGSNIITRDNYCLRRQHIKKGYSLSRIDSFIQ